MFARRVSREFAAFSPLIGFFLTAMLAAATFAAPFPDDQGGVAPDVACAEIRASIDQVARAEREQALALHLTAEGRPTPVVETKLTELQSRIGDLRETLRKMRHHAPIYDQHVAECIDLGFRSLSQAESLSSEIEDIVMRDDGPLGLPPQLKPSGELPDVVKLRQLRAHDDLIREE